MTLINFQGSVLNMTNISFYVLRTARMALIYWKVSVININYLSFVECAHCAYDSDTFSVERYTFKLDGLF